MRVTSSSSSGRFRGRIVSWAAVLCVLTVVGCSESGGALDEIRETGELVVLTRYGSTTYYEGRDGEPDGYEYALTQAFAAALNVSVRYEILDSVPDVLEAIKEGRGHIAAAALTRTPEREQVHEFGPDYKTVQQQVVCRRRGPLPDDVEDLGSVSLLVLGGSSYVERLRELRESVPGLDWQATEELSTDEILGEVWEGNVDCAVADSNIVAINRRYYPDLTIAFPITEEQQLAWVLPPGSEELAELLEDWFDDTASQGLLAKLDERYYGHVTIFDYVDLKRYQRRIRQRLPKYREFFEKAATKHALSWTLLAAQAYQESHWNPKAKSPTGVRGMMMLTRTTAKSLGISNRLDVEQSIMGGARYLSKMLSRVPEQVKGRDRIWFALAAYNVGFGHMQDARELARRLDKDPNRWHELKSVLPLLSRKKYYRTLKHGYARGSEPVRYVERVREFRDVLEWHLANDKLATDFTE